MMSYWAIPEIGEHQILGAKPLCIWLCRLALPAPESQFGAGKPVELLNESSRPYCT